MWNAFKNCLNSVSAASANSTCQTDGTADCYVMFTNMLIDWLTNVQKLWRRLRTKRNAKTKKIIRTQPPRESNHFGKVSMHRTYR